MSVAAARLEGGLSDGLTTDKVVSAVERLVSAYVPVGVVYGAGFEYQAQAEEITHAVAAIASKFDLVGLNSVYFLVSDEAVWLLEINPRRGATLDVFETNKASLFAHHLAACEGRLTPIFPNLALRAAETVYAPCDIVIGEGRNWPDWAADRSPPGTRIAADDPLCTVLGSGATVDLARASASERARSIVALVQEAHY